MKLEGAHKAIKSNPLLDAGIQIKGYLPGGSLECLQVLVQSLPLKATGSVAIVLHKPPRGSQSIFGEGGGHKLPYRCCRPYQIIFPFTFQSGILMLVCICMYV